MPSIFIDTNIILGFWSLRERRIPSELLLPLVEIKDHVLITSQVVGEVCRNKLETFLESSNGKFEVNSLQEFPSHMLRERGAAHLNTEIRELKKKAGALNTSMAESRVKFATEISMGTDLTTQMLSPLLKSGIEPTEAQLARARVRRELGNPPGKKADPLGDQISWEQFLDAVNGEETVWIITRDSDFTSEVGGVRMLNPFLQAELSARGVKNVHVLDNLAEALKELKAAGFGAAAKIEDARLDELAKEEARANPRHRPYDLWSEGPWQCPKCSHVSRSGLLTPRPSRYGGWSYWAICTHCGFQMDTGEPYDD